MERKLDVQIREVDGVSILDVNGTVDRHTIDVLEKALEQLVESGKVKILINGASLSYISSNGMGVFITYVERVREKGGDIRFCMLQDVGRTVITVLGLHNLFQIFDTEDDGLRSFQGM